MIGFPNVAYSVAFLLLVANAVEPRKDERLQIPGVHVVPPGDGEKLIVNKDELFGGNALNSFVTIFDDDPQKDCPQLAGLFAVTPHGASIILPARRDELGINVDEAAELSSEQVKVFHFETSSCRLSVAIEKQIKTDRSWAPLIPAN